MTHELKTWPEPFEAVWMYRKTAEFRPDDRGFSEGDMILLREWCPHDREYLGREIRAMVTDVRRGGGFGIPVGFAMLSFVPLDRKAVAADAAGVPLNEGDGPIMTMRPHVEPTPRDWTEDASHENGNYNNVCCGCNRTFTGHKRRGVCRECYEAQRVSFAYGNAAMSNPAVARADVEKAAEQMRKDQSPDA